MSAVPVHSGWCLKKSKTGKVWDQAHHSHRYFLCQGAVLSYHEGNPSNKGSSQVQGVIDLRQVKSVRASVDKTAPDFAIDMCLPKRTYVLVPQPATAEERAKWISTWMQQLHGDIIAPELRAEASALLDHGAGVLADQPSALAASGVRNSQPFAGPGGPSTSQQPAGSGMASGSASVCPPPRVLMQGFMQKQPAKHSGQHSISAKAIFADLSGWKRRYFLLRPGTLQWFRDDPSADGEFLGVLRLGPDTRVEFEKGQQRLRVVATGGSLLLKDDGSRQMLLAWQQALKQHVGELGAAGAPGTVPSGDDAAMSDRDLEDDAISVS